MPFSATNMKAVTASEAALPAMIPDDVSTHEQSPSLTLTREQRDLLTAEIDALLQALPANHRASYEALARAAGEGSIPNEHLLTLEKVLQMMLTSGHARHTHRADGERLLQDLYGRTSRGRALKQQQDQTNRALRALEGQAIDSIQVSINASGRNTIWIATEKLQVTLMANQDGIYVDKAEV